MVRHMIYDPEFSYMRTLCPKRSRHTHTPSKLTSESPKQASNATVEEAEARKAATMKKTRMTVPPTKKRQSHNEFDQFQYLLDQALTGLAPSEKKHTQVSV